jgi:hypothetical protein
VPNQNREQSPLLTADTLDPISVRSRTLALMEIFEGPSQSLREYPSAVLQSEIEENSRLTHLNMTTLLCGHSTVHGKSPEVLKPREM